MSVGQVNTAVFAVFMLAQSNHYFIAVFIEPARVFGVVGLMERALVILL